MKTYYKIGDSVPRQLRVDGWLRDFLIKESDGMPGHLHKIGYPFNCACWQSRSMTDGGYAQWWPYEQSAYWIDAMVRTAAVLGDDTVLDKVREQIDASVCDDGEPFMGPRELKEEGGCNRWPHAVYFRALWVMYLHTGDEKYIRRIREHYLSDPSLYNSSREVANIESMYRVAAFYDDDKIKEKADHAIATFEGYTSLVSAAKDIMPHTHGVTINEDMKLGAVAYLYTGNRTYLEASINLYEKLATFHMLPDGVHTSYECTTGNESFKVHESCDISDYTYGLGFLLKATFDGKYADRIERACFNALPGATGPNFRTIQYLSCVNQVISTRNSTHLSMWENTPRMAYQPHHYPECCVANIGRAMPNYALNMYGDTSRGLAISLYAASSYDGKYISVQTETFYPFEESISFRITRADAVKNFLSLRIPAWSKGYILTVNGRERHYDVTNGYIRFRVHNDDSIVLRFRFALVPAHSSDGGIYYSFGPLLMTLKLHETWATDPEEKRQTQEFPAYRVTTDDSFGYALSGYEGERAVVTWKTPGSSPFWDGSYPIEIRLNAKRLSDWNLVVKKNKEDLKLSDSGEGIDAKQIACGATQVHGDLLLTPRLPCPDFVREHLGGNAEITLVPYGCTCLRLSVFPKYDYES